MNTALALHHAPAARGARHELAAAAWTAVCITVALALLFAFFFRMEESVAQELQSISEAEWAQRHWQCSAVPVMKQAACEAQLARLNEETETADASAAVR
jgi:hypothetical protein